MKKLLFLLLCLCILLSACTAESEGDKVNIVATMFPQYDFAREIAKDAANVELLLDFGADSHSYEPTPLDIMKIASADLFIYTGDEMELWAKTLLESADVKRALESGKLKVLDLSKHVNLLCMHDHDEEDGHGHSEYDTHIWTSAENAEKMCSAIASVLCEIDIENAAFYSGNFEIYSQKLSDLSKGLKNLGDGEIFFGGSFAFRYMFAEAGLSHASIYEGCSSHAEPSAADIAAMVDKIKASGAKYVFYDSASEKKIAESIAAECGVSVLHLHAVHNITKAEFDAGETYLSLMGKNIETLQGALF